MHIEGESIVDSMSLLCPSDGSICLAARSRRMFTSMSQECFPLKAEMRSCNKSQPEWLRAQSRTDEYVESMERWSRVLGRQTFVVPGRGMEFAEAYRQHRGHAYPRAPVLDRLLIEHDSETRCW
jgi:hypothetical protein